MRYVGLALIVLFGAVCLEHLFGMVLAVGNNDMERATQVGRSIVGPAIWLVIGMVMRTRAEARADRGGSEAAEKP